MGSFSFSIFLIYAYLSSAKPDIKLMIFSSFHCYSSHLKFYPVILFLFFKNPDGNKGLCEENGKNSRENDEMSEI